MATERAENMLFKHLASGFEEERKKFEEQRESESNRLLLEQARRIVQAARKDKIVTEEAGGFTPADVTQEGEINRDEIIITRANAIYGARIKPGESAVAVTTGWFPYAEEHDLGDRKTSIHIRLEETSFTSITDDGINSRIGDVVIIAKASDIDGVKAERIIAGLGPSSEEEGKYLLNYSFNSPIRPGTHDYQMVESIMSSLEGQVFPPPADTPSAQ